MSTQLIISTSWWTWWSNPLVNIHEDHLYKLALPPGDSKKLDYFKLLELRNELSLDEIPDKLVHFKPHLRCLAYATPEQVFKHLSPLALFTLDNSILHARPRDWEDNFGVSSPDHIRDLISKRTALPQDLSEWYVSLCRHLALNLKTHLHLQDRTILCLGVILKSFTPALYQRWLLTQSNKIILFIKTIDAIPSELWDPLNHFIDPLLHDLNNEASERFSVTEFDLTLDKGDLEFDEDLLNPAEIDDA